MTVEGDGELEESCRRSRQCGGASSWLCAPRKFLRSRATVVGVTNRICLRGRRNDLTAARGANVHATERLLSRTRGRRRSRVEDATWRNRYQHPERRRGRRRGVGHGGRDRARGGHDGQQQPERKTVKEPRGDA